MQLPAFKTTDLNAFGQYGVLGSNPLAGGGNLPYLPSNITTNPGEIFSTGVPSLDSMGGMSTDFVTKPLGNGLFSGLNSAQKINAILGGIGTIGGLYTGFKQLGLANKQFNFQREFSNANMANQVQSYNTTLADRSRSRAVVEGQNPAQAQSYIDANKLTYKAL